MPTYKRLRVRCLIVRMVMAGMALWSFVALAGEQSKPLSPTATAQCQFTDGKTVTINYSSPSMKGRKIFGGLVPYGQIWRTGANEATSLIANTNIAIEGKNIPAGSYTIFTIPNLDQWILIINKKTGEWGIPYKYEADELTRTTLSVAPLAPPLESLSIAFQQMRAGCVLRIRWESVDASGLVAEAK